MPLLGRAEYIHDLSSAPSGGTFCWPLFQVNPMTVYQVEERSQGPGGLRHPWKLCIMLHAISISISLSMYVCKFLFDLICIHLHMHSMRCHDLCMSSVYGTCRYGLGASRAPTQCLLPPSSQFPVLLGHAQARQKMRQEINKDMNNMCVCIYIYIHTHVYCIHIHIYIHTYIHMYTVYIYIYIYIYIHTYIHTYIHVYVYVYV